MKDNRHRQSLANLGKALGRLGQAVKGPYKNQLEVDGTIQRFEFVIELYWKTIRHLLAAEGIQCGTPRECLKKAYQAKWLKKEKIWLSMLKDRNLTSHIYNENVAKKIYKRIKTYFVEMERTYHFLKKKG